MVFGVNSEESVTAAWVIASDKLLSLVLLLFLPALLNIELVSGSSKLVWIPLTLISDHIWYRIGANLSL